MNILHRIQIRTMLFLFLFAFLGAGYSQPTYITVTGTLKDSKTGEKIAHATIRVPGTSVGTVSNAEGAFILKVSADQKDGFFEVSHLSYAPAKFRISESAGKDNTFTLEQQPIQLKEVAVVPQDARVIVEMALNAIRKNYSPAPNMMTGFYRESIRQGRDYLSVSEAVVDIYKGAYAGGQDDQVRIYKGRKGSNVKKADTLMVQLQGGPHVAMLLDLVKNTDLGIAIANLDNYDFEIESMASVDNHLNWVISFSPAVVKEDPLYYGKLYIAQETMAITRAEFSLDLKDETKAASMFIRKKPAGLKFVPEITSYLVNYKEQNGRYYISYVRAELKFKCDWKKRLFKNRYVIVSEVAITDRREDNIAKFTGQDLFRPGMVFTEKVQDFEDAGFWGEYNIIEPESTIESAIKKLSKTRK
jgi:hypothetical protein